MSGCGRHSSHEAQTTRRAVCAGVLSAPLLLAAKPFTARVSGVSRYGNLALADGRSVRPADLHLLRPPRPFGLQTQDGLKALCMGRTVEVDPTGPDDRYGNVPARVRLEDGSSLQEEMLRLGLARLRPRGDTPSDMKADLSAWFALEDTARASGRGLWSLPNHAVKPPDADSLAQLMDSFQIIEGVVVATGGPKARTYLNFGSDWKTDVTVVVERKLEKLLPEPVRDLAGARVEARGWIEMVNGPSIWLEDARALRILS